MMRLISLGVLIFFIAIMLSPRLRAWLWARAPILVLGTIGAIAVALAATGRLNWIFAAIGAALPIVWRLASLLRFLPWITRLLGMGSAQARQGKADEGQQGRKPGGSRMSREEAIEILGLEPGADREAILAAHRRLMQKLHPDRGGTDYLAARLNEARDRLLEER